MQAKPSTITDITARARYVARRGDGGHGRHQHRPAAQRKEGRRCRRHALIPILQIDDEAGYDPAGRRAQDRQGAE